ncbi:MAG: hypothetical protein ACYSVY_28835, partial [Planctomycetota bacterium]
TLDSTGQANALMKVTSSLGALEQNLLADLGQTPRRGAVLVIQTNPINAFWTQAAIDANPPGTDPLAGAYLHAPDPERETIDAAGAQVMSVPRADVLMTFTIRKGTSNLCPNVGGKLQQVVYGHAEIGELDATGGWAGGATPALFAAHPNPPIAGTIFPTPAEDWHLARRGVLILDVIVTDPLCPVEFGLDGVNFAATTPANLWDGVADIVAKDPLDPGGSFHYKLDVEDRTGLSDTDNDLVVDQTQWFARSRLDLAPPAPYANRAGHYFIPHCASFKVEWALDLQRLVPFTAAEPAPKELAWFDPARGVAAGAPDPLGELDDLVTRMGYTDPNILNAINTGPTSIKQLLLGRFTAGSTGIDSQTPVWFANDVPNGGSLGATDRYFPHALRITVDVYDKARKLERPLRHVMVLPVGR